MHAIPTYRVYVLYDKMITTFTTLAIFFWASLVTLFSLKYIIISYCFTSLQNAWGYTPLIGASMTGQADITKLLLEHKANVDYRDKKVSSTYNMSGGPYCSVIILCGCLS